MAWIALRLSLWLLFVVDCEVVVMCAIFSLAWSTFSNYENLEVGKNNTQTNMITRLDYYSLSPDYCTYLTRYNDLIFFMTAI